MQAVQQEILALRAQVQAQAGMGEAVTAIRELAAAHGRKEQPSLISRSYFFLDRGCKPSHAFNGPVQENKKGLTKSKIKTDMLFKNEFDRKPQFLAI